MLTEAREKVFWSRVTKTDTCWLFQPGQDPNGYTFFSVGGRSHCSHRVSYVLAKGDIPEGCEIDHLCFVRNCVNPAHLEAVPRQTNLQRRKGANKTNVVGVRGVRWHEKTGKYQARLQYARKSYYCGYHDTVEAASAAIEAKRAELVGTYTRKRL